MESLIQVCSQGSENPKWITVISNFVIFPSLPQFETHAAGMAVSLPLL